MDLPVVIYIVQHLGASGGSCDTGEANLATSLSFHSMALELRVMSKSLNPAEPWLSHPEKGSPCFSFRVLLCRLNQL